MTTTELAQPAALARHEVREPLRPHDPSPAGIAAAWAVEIRRRVAAFERGNVKAYAAEDVFAEAHRLAR
ncbi:addiction module protein [Ramlibacter albus]|uniref:Addiction module protein n=1 Tax=Ramlibacter albus TaxID=2079448 RepID=A0A923MAQ5_9BURK|nr:addiction module protein [Ramlibacter albus]MBC5766525.1 addiction module protein [Ramlibacter albus]